MGREGWARGRETPAGLGRPRPGSREAGPLPGPHSPAGSDTKAREPGSEPGAAVGRDTPLKALQALRGREVGAAALSEELAPF